MIVMSDAFANIAHHAPAQEALMPTPAPADEENLLSHAQDLFLKERNARLNLVAPETVRKAWFTLAHILPRDGAHIVDMGCDDGAMSYAMAALNPRVQITGLDKDKRKITKAQESFTLDNLAFKTGDVVLESFKENSLDAIVNSFILHEVYSGYRYNETIVSTALEKQFKALKRDGVMFVRDYTRPPPGEFVLLEAPDKPSFGTQLDRLSDADLLVWYSEHAQPRQDPGCRGFFLEELPPRFPGTRLFRLPYKWAYEFLMRKDDRERWDLELPMDYTFFTQREFRKELKNMGARVEYAAPHWDKDFIKTKLKGKFRLYNDQGKTLGFPATSYILLARKVGEQRSLNIEERRPSPTGHSSSLHIQTMRNEQNGELTDIVGRDRDACEILPYRITEDGRLSVILHEGLARGLTNAVSRSGINLDGRQWSGHLIEAICLDDDLIADIGPLDHKSSALFAQNHLGLKAEKGAVLEEGMSYYPSPDYIDEKIQTYYLKTLPPGKQAEPRSFFGSAATFQAKGRIREFDAQNLLDAITVGMIPNARLELQILSLFNRLKLRPETWTAKDIPFTVQEITSAAHVRKYTSLMGTTDTRFKLTRGAAGQLRSIHSVFVEDGHAQGSITGLSAADIDFVIKNNETVNTAVVVPLTKGAKNDLHAGFLVQHLPVPQRHNGSGLTFSAPSFNLPPDITDMEGAQRYLAERFNVLPEMVFPMGESYYSHIGITPQRIYPFGLAIPPGNPDASEYFFIPLEQMRMLWKSISTSTHFMTIIARTYKYFQQDMRFAAKRLSKQIEAQAFDQQKPKWSILDRIARQKADWGLPGEFIEAPVLKNAPDAPQEETQILPKEETKNDSQKDIKEKIKAKKPAKSKTAPKSGEKTKDTEKTAKDGSNKPRPEKW